jgi:maltose alpha-D-glucosyltransferase/alpha-amylase
MKRMLQVRKTSQAFGRGTLRFIRPGNRKVLVYVRQYGDDTILCVVNLARSAQPVELDLSDQKGAVPIELLGRTSFPPIGELPYFLTLPSYGFYWFRLSREAQAPPWHDERLPREDLPVLVLIDGWNSFFPDRVANWRAGLATKLRAQLESRVIPQFIAAQRWYAGKGSPIASAHMGDYGEWSTELGRWLLATFNVESRTETAPYLLPLAVAFEDSEESRWHKLQAAAIARVRQQATVGVLADACADENFCRSIVDAIGKGSEVRTHLGHVRFSATQMYTELRVDTTTPLPVSPAPTQGSNTAVRVGEPFFLKIYRRLHAGINPELEIGRYLTEVVRFPNIVPVAGAVEYRSDEGTTSSLALLQAFVSNQGDGWDYTVNYLVRFLEDRRTGAALPDDVHGLYLALMRTLATRTAELHRALSMPTSDPAFEPEPITSDDVATWRAHVLEEAQATFEVLAKRAEDLPQGVVPEADALLGRREALLTKIKTAGATVPPGLKIRHHGDYHLGQVLIKRNDFIIADFEGEPARPLAERRMKHSPLRDVAGMLRSFAYARQTASQRCALQSPDDCGKWEPLLEGWERETREVFITVYDEIARAAGLYESFAQMQPLLTLFEIEKALYEVRYELGNRPDWTSIPLHSLVVLAGAAVKDIPARA